MRRALAAAVLGISLWVGSLAWTGFILTRTVLDPSRSAEAADALYDDDAVRSQLAANLADAIGRAVPAGVPVDREVLEAAATEALESPAVRAVFLDTLVATHAAFLGEGEAPSELDAGAVGAATRDALVSARPELGPILPESPELVIDLPTERVPDLGPLRRALLSVVPALALASAVGATTALVVTSNWPAVLRRAGFWAMGLSAGVLAFAYGIPALARRFAPEGAEVVGALVGAMAASARGPAIGLGGAGVAAVAVSFLWRSPHRAGGQVVAPPVPSPDTARRGVPDPTAPPPRSRRRDLAQPYRRPAPAAVPPAGARTGHVPRPARQVDPTVVHGDRTIVGRDATGQLAVPSEPSGRSVLGPESDDATSVFDEVGSRPPPSGIRATHVPGVGWVLAPDEDIPPEARWVHGHGYVVDG